MREVAFANEPVIRLAAFGGVFVLLAALEFIVPRRKQAIRRSRRWPNNLGVVIVDTLLLRILFPTTAVGLALVAEARGFGLLNVIRLPDWLALLAAFLVLDLAIYLQHVLFHAVPALWRLHRMHHADLDFDVTTGLRFHPIEICSRCSSNSPSLRRSARPRWPCCLRGAAQRELDVQSRNVRMPARIRSRAALARRHAGHAPRSPLDLARETNSNFGFNLPWWDRLFGTYRAQPAAGS